MWTARTPGIASGKDMRAVTAAIRAAKKQADYVIVDLPPLSSPAARITAPHCDCVVLIVDREATCLAASGIAAELLRSWAHGESELGAVVVNQGGRDGDDSLDHGILLRK